MSRLDAVEENISGPKNMAVESMKNETEKKYKKHKHHQ